MIQVSDFPFAEVFDTRSLLLAGSLFLFSVLLVQIVWVYRRRSGSRSGALRTAATDDADDDMVVCPECSEPTESEYRYCRHCAGDTGKSYVGSRGEDGSKGSGML